MDEQRVEPTMISGHDWRQMCYDAEQLKMQVKGLQQDNGRLGARIHELRCELAETREINHKIARGELRDLERESARNAEIIAELRREVTRLSDLNAEAREKLDALTSVDS